MMLRVDTDSHRGIVLARKHGFRSKLPIDSDKGGIWKRH